jgi:hypothetical protein
VARIGPLDDHIDEVVPINDVGELEDLDSPLHRPTW